MLKITIPFTNEVVLDTANYRESEQDEIIINQFDEVREMFELSVKVLMMQEITIFVVSLKCQQSVLIRIAFSNNARITNFNLCGTLHVKMADFNKEDISLLENTYHSFTGRSNQNFEMVIHGEADLFISCLNANMVNRLVPPAEMAVLKNNFSRPITSSIKSLINTIVHHAKADALHRILLVAKIIELLFLDLEQLKKNRVHLNLPGIKLHDRQKLEAARKLISENIQTPCSLIALAHKVGLNDFKLKKGFKEIFGTTVFGYLSDLRMEKAKQMLLSSKFMIAEVAHEVGYKNPHHFTTAYKKKFGHLPSKTAIFDKPV